jgi:hypothetical protein
MSNKTLAMKLYDLAKMAEELAVEADKEESPELINEEDLAPDYTPEELSEMLTGDPNFYLSNPELYNKMLPYANPEKVPFTDYTWTTTMRLGRDARQFKNVVVDGVEYRRTPEQIGPDWYWIIKGVQDVSDKTWLRRADIGPDRPAKSIQLELVRNYKGGLRQSLGTWPDDLKEAYQQSH